MSVFAVTTIRIIGPNGLPPQVRTVGLFLEKEKAFAVLDENLGSLIEAGWYHYAVVEQVPEGLYPVPGEDGSACRWFWKAVGDSTDNEHWVKLDHVPDVLPDDTIISYCQIG